MRITIKYIRPEPDDSPGEYVVDVDGEPAEDLGILDVNEHEIPGVPRVDGLQIWKTLGGTVIGIVFLDAEEQEVFLLHYEGPNPTTAECIPSVDVTVTHGSI